MRSLIADGKSAPLTTNVAVCGNIYVQLQHSIRIRLKEAIEAYRERTGTRLTLANVADATGLSVSTLKSLSARDSYNTRLSTIARLCGALDCKPGDLLESVKPAET